ncbi:putative toxin-antitoxin system toxin component, PIN family [Ramlibacter albus]|uniref:Toxin-antitoxin system toxin component, PIN family n=1 Tax=Ramlibacter albus TaxID=2079448 RepID=A0A923MB24_9BURK|nr:putative toxin-antitoxin system toxin component, PIN family [Ramlibacter albus]MBC5766951.1 putative toxin-antitoxin system toxin component, PIN family [Ramlibacter albus]
MRADRRLAVVVDTNVWISAALSRDGAPALVVRRVLSHGVPVFSERTFHELESRLWKPKFDRYLTMELRKSLLHDLNAAALWVDVPEAIAAVAHSRDADDDHFVHAALAAGAPWLVTGDQDLLALKPMPGLQVVTPAKALTLEGLKG